MINMLLVLFGLASAPKPVAKVQPCVWPNTCATEKTQVAITTPCPLPNICSATEVAQYETCVWPKTCSHGV